MSETPPGSNGRQRVPTSLEELLSRYIEGHLVDGRPPDPDTLCADCPELLAPLKKLIAQYERVDGALSASPAVPAPRSRSDGEHEGTPGFTPGVPEDASAAPPLPAFPGFRTIERLGRGGAGEVYKLEDLTLGRIVAAKVLRRDNPLASTLADFLREARSLALFEDPHIVRLLEFRTTDPPILLMEYVDGFELSEIGRSLDYEQRARLVAEMATALHRAHALGLQHRDLKPSNILVDFRLQPKILDFGLSRGEPHRGHGVGTLAYMAPEQLDPARAIDARTDVYALGVVLYELLCGSRPFADDADEGALAAAIQAGEPRLPVEVEPSVPEPLQAIALKAMARDPRERYASADEMALDLRRFIEGRPVLARPPLYRSALDRRVQPHVEQIREWEDLRLIYPHEGERLRAAYRRIESREDDWIVQSRVLSFSQIALYLGAFLALCGGLLYFEAHLRDGVSSAWHVALVLGLPCLTLTVVAEMLGRRQRRAVAVAFYLGGAVLLPWLLLVLARQAGLWPSISGSELELFERVSNRQMQMACLLSSAWVAVLAVRTHTVALSSCFTALLCVTHLAFLADFGLRRWIEQEQWDRLAGGLAPLVVAMAVFGRGLEARARPWIAEPLYLGATLLHVAALELVALNGRAFAYLGVTLAPVQPSSVSDPHLIDAVGAMTINGVLIYLAGWLLDRRGTPLMRTPAWLLFSLSPFAILEPLAHLANVGEYSRRFDWLYLAAAITVALLSRFRQRHSFFYAGLLNTSVALWLITDHYEWLDRRAWAVAVVVTGVLGLAIGLILDLRRSVRRISSQGRATPRNRA